MTRVHHDKGFEQAQKAAQDHIATLPPFEQDQARAVLKPELIRKIVEHGVQGHISAVPSADPIAGPTSAESDPAPIEEEPTRSSAKKAGRR